MKLWYSRGKRGDPLRALPFGEPPCVHERIPHRVEVSDALPSGIGWLGEVAER
jgi:hypothetical protein